MHAGLRNNLGNVGLVNLMPGELKCRVVEPRRGSCVAWYPCVDVSYVCRPGIAQEGANVIVFLKSQYYAEVEQSVRLSGEKISTHPGAD